MKYGKDINREIKTAVDIEAIKYQKMYKVKKSTSEREKITSEDSDNAALLFTVPILFPIYAALYECSYEEAKQNSN